MTDLVKRLQQSYVDTNFQYEKKLSTERVLLREAATEIERQRAENKRERQDANKYAYKLVVMLKYQELLEKVVEAADYLKTEFLEDWQLGRLSVDTKAAATAYEEKRRTLTAFRK